MQGDFDKLDDLASDYRSTRIRMTGGFWALGTFYNIVSAFEGAGCGCFTDISNVAFDAKRKQLELWLASKPASSTARIALAGMWENYAWMHRGGEFANKVGDAQWEGYYEGLARADNLLREVDPVADPVVFLIEMHTASRLDDPRTRLDDLYARAVKAFPTFIPFYTRRYRDLQERWYGRPGESTEYIASLLQSPGAEEGAIIYVAVAETALQFERTPAKLLDFSGVSYGRLIQAYGARQRAVGLTNYDWNALMFYGGAALDRNGVAFVAKKTGDRWEKNLWGTKEYFDSWVDWSARWL
jgi:hypothetical protein